MKIGSKIKRIREIKNISQKVMASKLEMSISGYNKIERDEVTINNEKLSKIAEVLHSTPSEIIDFNDQNVFINSYNNTNSFQFGVFDTDIKKLYEEKIAMQQAEINKLKKDLNECNEKKNR